MGVLLGVFVTAKVKVWLLVCSQLFHNNLKFSFFTGEFLASGLTSFNRVSLFPFFRGFILVNNFGESHLDGCLLTGSILTPKIRDVFFALVAEKGFSSSCCFFLIFAASEKA